MSTNWTRPSVWDGVEYNDLPEAATCHPCLYGHSVRAINQDEVKCEDCAEVFDITEQEYREELESRREAHDEEMAELSLEARTEGDR